jgi:hypothetical protein
VTARALGADLGQGWLFGRPMAADDVTEPARGVDIRIPDAPVPPRSTPYEAAAALRPVKIAHLPLLLEMSRFLESRALREGDSSVVLSTFQYAGNLTPATARRYRRLTASGAIVALLAHGLAPQDVSTSMHWVDLPEDDPLTGEWDVAVISPDFAALLTARELPSENGRRFTFVLTHERRLVLDAARSLLTRLGGR